MNKCACWETERKKESQKAEMGIPMLGDLGSSEKKIHFSKVPVEKQTWLYNIFVSA